jgi:hypothetical protein
MLKSSRLFATKYPRFAPVSFLHRNLPQEDPRHRESTRTRATLARRHGGARYWRRAHVTLSPSCFGILNCIRFRLHLASKRGGGRAGGHEKAGAPPLPAADTKA